MKLKSFKMYGKSSQAKYNGINLIDYSKAKSNVGNVEIKRNGNLLSITNNNTYVAIVDIPMMLDVDTYYMSISSSSSIPIYRNDKWFANGILENSKKGTFKISEKAEYNARITIKAQSTSLIDSLMCCTLENAEYEPYTGGKPSPSTEYPQEIISKEISEIKITGSNLMTDDDITGQGTVNLSVCKTKGVYLEKGIPYVFSVSGSKTPTAMYLIRLGETDAVAYTYNNFNFKFTVQNSGRYWLKIYDTNLEFQNEWINSLRLNIEKDYGYEPYKEQAVTLSQPISLHGIPASSDSNISIDGKQYISDVLCEKDGNIGIERNCGYIEHYIDENVGDTYISTTGELSNGASVFYKLEVSTFEPLPLIDQTKIRNITSYYPTTNIHIDAYSEVEYIADTKTYIDNKIAGVSTALIKGV